MAYESSKASHSAGRHSKGAGLAHLSQLKRIKNLDLSNTQITDADLAHLANLTNLEELQLVCTPVSNAGLAHLAKLTKLKVLRAFAPRE